jgi:hypothetical protein
MFSIELDSKDCIRRLALPNNSGGSVLIEGFLGKIEDVSLVEGLMLEVKGTSGTLKMDLTADELNKLLKQKSMDQGRSDCNV